MDFYTNVCRRGDRLLVRGYRNGKPVRKTINYRPNLFVLSKKENTPYKTLDGRPLDIVNLDSMKGARGFKDTYSDIQGFEIHGYDRWVYTWISDNWPGDIPFDTKLIRAATLDIECESENGFPDPVKAEEIVNGITMKPFGGKPVVFGIGPLEENDWSHGVDYRECFNEANLLMKFMDYWRHADFDIITGWNVDTFDITYLCNRIDKLFGEDEHKKLSPWGISDVREFTQYGYQKNMKFTLYGVNVVDYLELYRKNTFTNQESYKLDHIAHVELGKRKLDYSEYGSLHSLYKENYTKYLEYNVQDVVLVEELEDKLGFLELIETMAYSGKCNYADTFGMVKYWETIIYNFLKEQGIQIPPIKKNESDGKIEGAFVKDPIVGGHKWVMSFDLASLYPHLIMQNNISPEKMVRLEQMSCSVDKLLNKEIDTSSLKDKDLSLTPKGMVYKRDKQGFLPELMEKFYDERKLWKKKMIGYQQEKEITEDPKRLRELDTLIKRAYNNQQVRKIALNSAYGALANQWFAFYSTELAESITSSGQLVIKWAEKTVNQYMNKVLGTEDEDFVVAIDTDSVYITFEKLVDMVFPDQSDVGKIVDFLNQVAIDKIEKILAEGYDDLADYTNAFQQKMFMDREVIADYGIWTAKKRYILNVHDNEGVRYKTPKLKMMGIETAKSSTPMWVRGKLEEAFRVIMSHEEKVLWEFVEESRKEFKTLPVPEVAFPRGCNGLHNYRDPSSIYRKGTPIHVRGSLLYNHYLVENKLDKRYEQITEGNKIKFCYLTMPNPLNENVISFPLQLPKELDIARFVDYDLQFSKTFIEPLTAVISKIGWTTEPVASLDAFFG